MIMVDFYPDTLSYWSEGESTRDAQGHYTAAEGSYSVVGCCRLAYSAPQMVSEVNDKKVISTTATIYAPKTLPTLPERGQKVKVTKGNDSSEHELTVINSERGLLHVRIWVE